MEAFEPKLDPAHPVHSRWLGLIDYQSCSQLQTQLSLEAFDHQETILGLEHSSVITLGKRSNIHTDLVFEKSVLEQKNFSVVETDRGGQATMHTPGQLVIYPILNLKKRSLGVRDYVDLLSQATVQTLKEFSVPSFLTDVAGVYTAQGKIAFIGIRIEKGISRHGISININNDLSCFDLIKPCGHASQKMDAVANYAQVSTQDFYRAWLKNFKF